jgi:hypothetical protein
LESPKYEVAEEEVEKEEEYKGELGISYFDHSFYNLSNSA